MGNVSPQQVWKDMLLSTADNPRLKQEQMAKLQDEALKLERVIMPPKETGGGVYSFLARKRLPYRGFPQGDVVRTIGILKRMIPLTLKYFMWKPTKIILGIIYFIHRKTFYKIIQRIYKFFIDYAYNALEEYRLKPERYCRCVQEIYRVFNILIEREGGARQEEQEMWRKIRDILCMFLEFDNAYRFRLQDLTEVVNLEKLKLTEEDRCFIENRSDYKFEGKMTQRYINTLPERIQEVKDRIERDQLEIEYLKKEQTKAIYGNLYDFDKLCEEKKS